MKNVRLLKNVMKRISGASVLAVVMKVEAHGVASVWRKNDS